MSIPPSHTNVVSIKVFRKSFSDYEISKTYFGFYNAQVKKRIRFLTFHIFDRCELNFEEVKEEI